MRGRVIDAVLARCGGSTRVNEGSPLSIFAVAVSQSNEVVIAGVESLDQGDTSRLVVRRYGLPSCPLSAASTSRDEFSRVSVREGEKTFGLEAAP